MNQSIIKSPTQKLHPFHISRISVHGLFLDILLPIHLLICNLKITLHFFPFANKRFHLELGCFLCVQPVTDHFSSPQIDSYDVTVAEDLGEIQLLKIEKQKYWVHDDWYLRYITVKTPVVTIWNSHVTDGLQRIKRLSSEMEEVSAMRELLTPRWACSGI
ncbi:methionine aminopeptidase [Platysternon megacephalum]|uniref:Methionine aminopeptidase n=1 Tax=Platysternon megacephalum TaxID=55544 RepID=A0A4D9DEY1_9SAUR|nr:methionine aminopeptidase [Platysternon megacephalum]